MPVKRRPAAVTIAILREPPHGIIFVERAAHLRDHPGQIGLPGGSIDPGDADLQAAALREMREEVGIAPERVAFVAELPLVRQRFNTFDVTPFVAIVQPGELTIDPSETAAVFTVPLATILGPALTDSLDFGRYRIWGLTAYILKSFARAWGEGDLATRVNAELL